MGLSFYGAQCQEKTWVKVYPFFLLTDAFPFFLAPEGVFLEAQKEIAAIRRGMAQSDCRAGCFRLLRSIAARVRAVQPLYGL
jgi:hypothetical protein